jgi:hypothetical protein
MSDEKLAELIEARRGLLAAVRQIDEEVDEAGRLHDLMDAVLRDED